MVTTSRKTLYPGRNYKGPPGRRLQEVVFKCVKASVSRPLEGSLFYLYDKPKKLKASPPHWKGVRSIHMKGPESGKLFRATGRKFVVLRADSFSRPVEGSLFSLSEGPRQRGRQGRAGQEGKAGQGRGGRSGQRSKRRAGKGRKTRSKPAKTAHPNPTRLLAGGREGSAGQPTQGSVSTSRGRGGQVGKHRQRGATASRGQGAGQQAGQIKTRSKRSKPTQNCAPKPYTPSTNPTRF